MAHCCPPLLKLTKETGFRCKTSSFDRLLITKFKRVRPKTLSFEIGCYGGDATDLKVFESVRLGSMNRAAAELNTVQSNVTARVRALEIEIGVILFQRHCTRLEITLAGRSMLPFREYIQRCLATQGLLQGMTGVPSACWKSAPWETTAWRFGSSQYSQAYEAYPKVRP